MEIELPPPHHPRESPEKNRRTIISMEPATFNHLELNISNTDQFGQPLTKIKTASQWFCNLFPSSAKTHGAPFLENRISSVDGFTSSSPLSVNESFMASALGGDRRLGHSVIYWSAECQFYYFDPVDQLYHATTEAKLGDLMRALFARCALELQKEIGVFQLFTTFRSDPVIKSIVERAKSVLAVSEDFFSATSPRSRVNGIEMHEKLARVFIEKALKAKSNEILLVGLAYESFAKIVREKDMAPIKRSVFKEMMKPLVREKFNICLRNDLVVGERYSQGWKDLAMVEAEV